MSGKIPHFGHPRIVSDLVHTLQERRGIRDGLIIFNEEETVKRNFLMGSEWLKGGSMEGFSPRPCPPRGEMSSALIISFFGIVWQFFCCHYEEFIAPEWYQLVEHKRDDL